MPSSNPLYLLPINTPYLSTAALSAVSDAAEIALALGRVLVEPAMRNGRVVSPFDTTWQRGARATLGSYWDLRPIERRQRFARLSALLDASANFTNPGWKLDDAVVVSAVGLRSADRIAKRPADEVRRFFATSFPTAARARLLVLSRFKPTVAHSGGHNFSAFGGAPYLPTAPALVREAEAITGELGRFACVQWRAERSSRAGTTALQRTIWVGCANQLAHSANARMEAAGLRSAVLMTDLYGGSDTMPTAGLKQAQRALEVLEGISGVTHPLHKIAARQQTDGGAAAQVELNVCARAALLITCTGALPGAQYCTKCARAYSSFVSRLLAVRAEVRPESGAVGW